MRIGTTGIYLTSGNVVDKAPTPSSDPNTPVIKRIRAIQTSATEFKLMLDVDIDPFKDDVAAREA